MKRLVSGLAALLGLADLGSCFSRAAEVQQPLHSVSRTADSPLLTLHKSLVDIPSISGSEGNVSAFLEGYLRERSFTVLVQPVEDGRDNIYAYLGDSKQARVLVTSHIDTVPPFFPYERRGDEIWGRGSVDAKGSVATQIIALEELVRAGEAREGDVSLLFVVGEENSGAGMKAANDLGLSWEAVIFGEPTELKLGRGHKGTLGFNITAHGKAGHSGYPEAGRSAIDILVRGLTALTELHLPHSEGYGQTTANVGLIEGGVAPNVIAEKALAVVHVRVAVNDPDDLWQTINETLSAVSPHIELSYRGGHKPVPLDYDIDGKQNVLK